MSIYICQKLYTKNLYTLFYVPQYKILKNEKKIKYTLSLYIIQELPSYEYKKNFPRMGVGYKLVRYSCKKKNV